MQKTISSDYPYPNYQPAIPGKDDFQILENLKEMIKNGQHELFRPIPRPAALASVYLGHIEPSFRSQFTTDQRQQALEDTISPLSPESRRNGSDIRERANSYQPNTPVEELPMVNTSIKPDTTNSSQAAPGSPKLESADVAENKAVPLLEHDDSTQEKERTTGLSLRDAPPLSDDRRWQEPRRSTEETGRPSVLPPKDQRLYEREREREREKDRELRPRDDRRSIARPPPDERHYEPSYDRPPRRPDDRPDLYPSASARHFESSPESRRPPLAERHYRPDEQTISPAYDPVSIADRHYRPDDRLQFDNMNRVQSSHLETTAIRSSSSDIKLKSPELHPIIGVSKVAELAAANRKAQTARVSQEERPSKPSLIERLNPPPSLQDRLSDPSTLNTTLESRSIKALEERLAPRESSIAPQSRPDERANARPSNGTASLASRTPPPDRARGTAETQISPSQPIDRVRVDDRSTARPVDYSRGPVADRGPPVSTRPGYSHETSPNRGYRGTFTDQRDVRTGSSYRPDLEKGVYERTDFIEAERYNNPSHPYLKRGPSPTPERGRPAHTSPSGHSGMTPRPREGPVSYERRVSPSRERRDWDTFGSAYSGDRSWRSEHEYRRPYDTRAPPPDKERYERDPPPPASRVDAWEPRDSRPNTYRPKSPVRAPYDPPRVSEPYTQPPPLSAPAGVGDRGTSFTAQRDNRRYTASGDTIPARVRPRSPSPDLRRRTGVEDARPPPKRVREDSYGSSNSYYPPLPRTSDYNTQNPPISNNGYYPLPSDRDFVRDRPPMNYPPHSGYDRRSPGPSASRLGDYPSRSYDRLPRDDRRYSMGPPPRTG